MLTSSICGMQFYIVVLIYIIIADQWIPEYSFVLFISYRYNHLKDTISKVEGEIQRLHDPLQLNLPTPPLKTTE